LGGKKPSFEIRQGRREYMIPGDIQIYSTSLPPQPNPNPRARAAVTVHTVRLEKRRGRVAVVDVANVKVVAHEAMGAKRGAMKGAIPKSMQDIDENNNAIEAGRVVIVKPPWMKHTLGLLGSGTPRDRWHAPVSY